MNHLNYYFLIKFHLFYEILFIFLVNSNNCPKTYNVIKKSFIIYIFWHMFLNLCKKDSISMNMHP